MSDDSLMSEQEATVQAATEAYNSAFYDFARRAGLAEGAKLRAAFATMRSAIIAAARSSVPTTGEPVAWGVKGSTGILAARHSKKNALEMLGDTTWVGVEPLTLVPLYAHPAPSEGSGKVTPDVQRLRDEYENAVTELAVLKERGASESEQIDADFTVGRTFNALRAALHAEGTPNE